MESLQILLKQMGESKVILTYTKLPEQILATYYRDKHISAIGINKSAMITKRFEFEVFKAAVGLHKTLSDPNYKVIIDDDNIDMLAPIGEALMKDLGVIIEDRIVVEKPKTTDYSNMMFYNINSLESKAGKALPMYKLMPKENYNLCRLKKYKKIAMSEMFSLCNSKPEYYSLKDKLDLKIEFYSKRLS